MSAEPEGDAEPPPDLGYRRWDCTADDPELLAQAADDARAAIEDGECIVLPTDTVYGIGADAFNADAVQRLLDAKVRGRDMPPPVLIGEPSLIRALATDIPDEARELVAKHWPGPLTIILKRQPSLRMDLGETAGTVALRVPDHELARDILRATGPMAVSSANISGLPAALTCDEAIGQLGISVSVYLDGGRVGTDGQPPSTIVDFTQTDHGQVLRRGALTLDVLRETLPGIEDLVTDDEPLEAGTSLQDEEPFQDEAGVAEDAPLEADASSGDAQAVDTDVVNAKVVDAEVVEAEPETFEEITQEILDAGTLDEQDPVMQEPVQPVDAWHEPTTDELRITHPDHDVDQPDLFAEDVPEDASQDHEPTSDPRI